MGRSWPGICEVTPSEDACTHPKASAVGNAAFQLRGWQADYDQVLAANDPAATYYVIRDALRSGSPVPTERVREIPKSCCCLSTLLAIGPYHESLSSVQRDHPSLRMICDADDAYYNDEPRYMGNGAAAPAAYAPRRAPQAYEPTPTPSLVEEKFVPTAEN